MESGRRDLSTTDETQRKLAQTFATSAFQFKSKGDYANAFSHYNSAILSLHHLGSKNKKDIESIGDYYQALRNLFIPATLEYQLYDFAYIIFVGERMLDEAGLHRGELNAFGQLRFQISIASSEKKLQLLPYYLQFLNISSALISSHQLPVTDFYSHFNKEINRSILQKIIQETSSESLLLTNLAGIGGSYIFNIAHELGSLQQRINDLEQANQQLVNQNMELRVEKAFGTKANFYQPAPTPGINFDKLESEAALNQYGNNHVTGP